jgi:hypothetical protein
MKAGDMSITIKKKEIFWLILILMYSANTHLYVRLSYEMNRKFVWYIPWLIILSNLIDIKYEIQTQFDRCAFNLSWAMKKIKKKMGSAS